MKARLADMEKEAAKLKEMQVRFLPAAWVGGMGCCRPRRARRSWRDSRMPPS